MKRDGTGDPHLQRETVIPNDVLSVLPQGAWQPLFSEGLAIISKCSLQAQRLASVANLSDAATVSEAYGLVELLASSESSAGPTLRFVNTGTIDRYEVLWALYPVQYLGTSYAKPSVLEADLAARFPNRFIQAKSQKIIVAGLSRVIEACYDSVGDTLAGKSTVLVISSTSDLRFLLALLNSKLLTFLFTEMFGALALQGGYLQINPRQFGRLPIRPLRFTTAAEERARLVRDGNKVYEDFLATGEGREFLQFVQQQLETERADVIHDFLCCLAERMVDMNKEKQAEMAAFITWLERHIGTRVNELSNKAKLRSFDEHDFSDLLRVLKSNQGRLLGSGIDVSSRKFQEELEREFTASLAKLNPLKARIAATDNLIDEIVFRLYGLSDDEIKLVKGESDAASTH
jgi:hypothetical protein